MKKSLSLENLLEQLPEENFALAATSVKAAWGGDEGHDEWYDEGHDDGHEEDRGEGDEEYRGH